MLDSIQDCFFYILHFTNLPFCKDTEDITVSHAFTDVPSWIAPKDATTVRVDSPTVISAEEIHSTIPVLTGISLKLQL